MPATAAINPRRRVTRDAKPSMTPSLIDSFQNMSLRKGDTFHSNANVARNDFWDPLESQSSSACPMPSRSTTCPKSLEDLLIGAGERRAAELLRKVDKAVKDNSKLALGFVLNEPEILPVPAFLAPDAGEDKVAPRLVRSHSHSSDSGIGSSIADSDASAPKKLSKSAPPSIVNHSMSTISAVTEEKGLSKYACEQIHKHIVKPILREDALKEFHPLIKDVPSRIGRKEITNLRELEKTLIFLAPEYSCSPQNYLRFCERTVRVLHTTVTTLHESDQKAPADRPYTQGYFFDLVEQIRRYALILAATREKQAKGEKLDEMDYSADESVSLIGGMTHNGKPAELVRHKDGKTISFATDRLLSPEEVAAASTKRPMSDAFADDDDALRSMARRKKNAKPEIHECSLCDKEFKRPCDLTKHLKTHERPWKCPNDNCKYHDLGWPTEKERDRHVNDKHSNEPPLYHCLFQPCPYTSKRESNCKQHMEKAHGWEYVRSKNNGKGRLTTGRLSKGSIPPSPASVYTPLTPIAPSPSVQSLSASETSRRASMAPPPLAGPSNWANMPTDFSDHFNMKFNFNDISNYPITPAMSDENYPSASSGTMSSTHSGWPQLDGSAFDDAISPDDLASFNNFNFGPNDFAFPEQVTPGSIASNHASGISPSAHLDQTFTYDAMNVDNSYDAAAGSYSGLNEDFTLFGTAAAPQHMTTRAEMFPSLTEGTWGTFGTQLDASHTSLRTGDSALHELFPELLKGNEQS